MGYVVNWRKTLVFDIATRLFLPTVYHRYNELLNLEFAPRSEIELYQRRKLKELLHHAVTYVPFYRDFLSNQIDFENFTLQELQKFPLLTKEDIVENYPQLQSDRIDEYNSYKNSSGGSTGEPVEFIQTKEYWHKAVAAKMFYAHMNGKEFGETEIKLWGSERDIIEGSVGIKERMTNWLYNRKLLNSFKLSESIMAEYIRKWNAFRPKYVWTYVDSIYEMAKYINRNKIEIHSPQSIVTTAGPLYGDVRELLTSVFDSHIINQYGSREVGDIACECPQQTGLHIFEFSHIVEILDENGNACKPGEVGEIYITLLTNYAFPLIRYKIGDTGSFLPDLNCGCGRQFKKLATIAGRISDHFINEDGSLIFGEYITHIFYHMSWIKQFQVIQESMNLILVKIVRNTSPPVEDLEKIENDIKLVLPSASVEIEYVDYIDKLESGKYRYVFSKISRA